MFIGPLGHFGMFRPSLDWGFGFGLRQMFGRDSYAQNVNRAGWMLGDWGNAMIDTDPWRMFQQSGRRFADDISNWLGLPPLPAPNFANPFSLLPIYDPMKSTQTYVGAPAGGSPGYSAPAPDMIRDVPPEKPLSEEERIEKAIKAEEAARNKIKDEKKAKDKAAADKVATDEKAKKEAAAARGKKRAERITAAAAADIEAIKKSHSGIWEISSLPKIKVSGHADNIYDVDGEKVICNLGSKRVVRVIIIGTDVKTKTVDPDFGVCADGKIYKKK